MLLQVLPFRPLWFSRLLAPSWCVAFGEEVWAGLQSGEGEAESLGAGGRQQLSWNAYILLTAEEQSPKESSSEASGSASGQQETAAREFVHSGWLGQGEPEQGNKCTPGGAAKSADRPKVH